PRRLKNTVPLFIGETGSTNNIRPDFHFSLDIFDKSSEIGHRYITVPGRAEQLLVQARIDLIGIRISVMINSLRDEADYSISFLNNTALRQPEGVPQRGNALFRSLLGRKYLLTGIEDKLSSALIFCILTQTETEFLPGKLPCIQLKVILGHYTRPI